MNPKILRGVAVGAGYFSHFQYEAWNRLPEATLVALCNRNLTRGEEAARRHGVPKVYGIGDYERMLDEQRPDFVDIITPPETHLELVEQAAARGIAIICQKPLAPDWEGSVAVVEAARRAGVRFMVHENWRWQPWYREIRRQLDAGAIGDLFSIAVRMRMGDGWPEDAYLDRQPFFRDYPRLLIFETGVHFLDTIRFLAGEAETVFARLQKRNPAIRGEDAGQVVVGFPDGRTALLDASRYNEADCEDPRYTFGTVRLDGAQGHLELDTKGGLTLKPLGQPSRKINYTHERRGFAGDCVFALQRHFVDSMLHDRPFESTGEDYLKTVRLVEAVYESHATGRAVHLAPDPA
ncbi:MAG: gfo/Idh/MocA family oxidoreductase [Puniceicoccaceae bacterium]|nr:MAG: gfo/Idh/MocA family oxidoreductase [Puniceicoccaceae bacterium]